MQLTNTISFKSSKDTDKELEMHSKSDNIEIMIDVKTSEFTEDLFFMTF